MSRLDSFAIGYITCALWSSTDESGGKPLDSNYCFQDIAPETMEAMVADCRRFQEEESTSGLLQLWYAYGETASRAGHDFWLTRNGHGAGFWDRFPSGVPAHDIGYALSEDSRAYGNFNLYIGDESIDGRIYGS